MLNCHNATQLLSESQDRKLKLGERVSLKMHLAICNGCRNFGKQVHILRKISRSYVKGDGSGDLDM